MRNRRLGFTLIEIVFTLTLVAVLAALSLWTLRPANSKAPSRGLAMALSEELSAARQLAISSGRPVALGIPVDGTSALASSIYRLEGWNLPTITWSKGFSGDFPNCGFAAVRWSGGTWTAGADESVVSKMGAFNLLTWLPDELEDDYIFCFTPDGGLSTNDLPALDNRYVVVVGQNLDVTAGGTGTTLNGAKDPISLMISPYGGIEVLTGTPGGSVPTTGSSANLTSAPVARTNFEPGEVRLSNIVVRPNLSGAGSDEGYCVPGQYVTLEVYAYDPEGRGLFAKWKQPGTNKGVFTYPNGGAPAGEPLESEVERMEFVAEPPAGVTLTWSGTTPPAGGLFRARWSWTVPPNSNPNDTYEIEVDVKDIKGEVTIINPPPKIKMTTAPSGRIIAERNVGGIWQLVQMNPDGSNPRVISPSGVQEVMASVDKSGSKMALLQGPNGNRYVKVRPLEGGIDRNITPGNPGNYTSVSLSPDGAWVAYHEQTSATGGILTVQQVDGGGAFTIPQSWTGSVPNPPRCRAGWTPDTQFLLYEADKQVRYRHLGSNNDDLLIDVVGPNESIYAPTSYVKDGESRVMFSVGNINPVLCSAPLNSTGPNTLQTIGSAPLGGGGYSTTPVNLDDLAMPDMDGGGGSAGSGGEDDCFPNVAYDGSFLAINRSDQGSSLEANQESLLLPRVGNNFVGPPIAVIGGNTRRPIWIP